MMRTLVWMRWVQPREGAHGKQTWRLVPSFLIPFLHIMHRDLATLGGQSTVYIKWSKDDREMQKCTKYSKILYPRNYRSRFLVGRLEDAKIEHLVHWPKFEGSSTSLGKQFCKLFYCVWLCYEKHLASVERRDRYWGKVHPVLLKTSQPNNFVGFNVVVVTCMYNINEDE